jgi:coenzyme F420 hydrogenase subunit beta
MSRQLAGLDRLQKQVLSQGLCSFCGACTGMCPYLIPFQGKVTVMDSCLVTETRCSQFCPRMGVDLDRISRALFGVAYSGEPLGEVRKVIIARSTEPEVRGRSQYGGTVSTLIRLALESGLIDTAVLTKLVDGIPQGITVSSPKEVLDCCGSSYLLCPVLEAFHRWQPRDEDKVGIVGTPCQTLALANMRRCSLSARSNAGRVSLVIGLFCTWALSHDFRRVLAKCAPLSTIRRTDIPPPPASIFNVYTEDKCLPIPLDEVRPFIPEACTLCTDMTSEMTDISVGLAEGIEGWNTVIIRTEKGQELVKTAVAKGRLEIGKLPKANLDHLRESAEIKKRRALQNLVRKSGKKGDLLYLKLKGETVERILGNEQAR